MLLREPLRHFARALVDRVPRNSNPDHVIAGNRRDYLETVLNLPGKKASADFGSLGVPISSMLLIAFVWLALKVWRADDTHDIYSLWLLGALILSTIAYVFVFAALFKFQPYTSRYFLMLAPVGALSTAFILEHLRGRVRSIAFYGLLLVAVTVTGETYFSGGNSGFENVVQTRPYRTRIVFNAHSQVIREEMKSEERLAYNLGSQNAISAGLFRHETGARSYFVTIGEVRQYPTVGAFLKATGYDAIVLHVAEVVNAEDVYRRVFAYEGKQDSRYSFAFYRLDPTERGNRHVVGFAFQTNGKSDFHEWSLAGSQARTVSVMVTNESSVLLHCRTLRGKIDESFQIPAFSSVSFELKGPTGAGDRILCVVEPVGVNYGIQLDGPTPLVNPYLFD